MPFFLSAIFFLLILYQTLGPCSCQLWQKMTQIHRSWGNNFSMDGMQRVNSIMGFVEANNLINSNQSGFRPNDSCESQLLSIVHDIYSSFDCSPSLEVRGIFLDISKALIGSGMKD